MRVEVGALHPPGRLHALVPDRHRAGRVLGVRHRYRTTHEGAAQDGGVWASARESRLPSIVLFAVHSQTREDHLARKLASSVSDSVGAYLTTHARLSEQGPAERVWRGGRGAWS